MENLPFAHNPLLNADAYVPDAEARVFQDRLYLYGSWDIAGRLDYCSKLYHVFSSDDLVHWTDHGVSFSTEDSSAAEVWPNGTLYAPDCICRDGRYYLYFCLSDGSEGVAESASPQGPFTNATPIEGMDGIDPGVFIDDDGQAYIYWGQFDRVRAARLLPGMRSIDPQSVIQPLSVAEHNFHEGSSMRKHGGLYYYVYADTGRHGERPTCLGYATATSPLGPFTYRGVIIDNFGCDPEVWNNHGSIAEYRGQWYVFYHRSSRGTIFSRRVCAEPIRFLEDGSIPEVEMTSQGMGGPIAATERLPASLACLLSGHVRIDAGPRGEALAQAREGDCAWFKYLDFGTGVEQALLHVDGGAGVVELRLDSPGGALLAAVQALGGPALLRVAAAAAGVHALVLVWRGEGEQLPDVEWVQFTASRA